MYIRTFGCQMNVADSEMMAQALADDYVLTHRPEEADLLLINTCAIRRKSEEKVRSLLGSLKALKQRRPQMILGVGGCVAQQEGERLLAAAPHLDLVFGTHGVYRLPELVSRAAQGQRPVDLELSRCFPAMPRRQWASSPVQALVTIMQGCDNFCAFCVVPYVRGREYSRESGEIILEVRGFLEAGGREVTLLGQNVNSYGRGLTEPVTFPELLRRLAALPGLARLRFATSHPRDLSPELMAAFSELAPLCEHLHLPVQSGSTRILSAMRRRHTREEFLELVDRIREAVQDIALSTDMIVGFPGETEGDFDDTLSLVSRVRFHAMFSFKYSVRPNTLASKRLPDDVPEPEKTRRLMALQNLQREIQKELYQAAAGRVLDVLVDGRSRRRNGEVQGRTAGNTVVNLPGPMDWLGRLLPVRIVGAGPNSLRGEAVAADIHPRRP